MSLLLHQVSVKVPRNNINFSVLEGRCSVSLHTHYSLGGFYHLKKLIGVNEVYTLTIDFLLEEHMGLKKA